MENKRHALLCDVCAPTPRSTEQSIRLLSRLHMELSGFFLFSLIFLPQAQHLPKGTLMQSNNKGICLLCLRAQTFSTTPPGLIFPGRRAQWGFDFFTTSTIFTQGLVDVEQRQGHLPSADQGLLLYYTGALGRENERANPRKYFQIESIAITSVERGPFPTNIEYSEKYLQSQMVVVCAPSKW